MTKLLIIIILQVFTQNILFANDGLDERTNSRIEESEMNLSSPYSNNEDTITCLDVIEKTDGKKINCHIVETYNRQIIYEKCNDRTNRQYSVRKKKIKSVTKSTGEKVNFKPAQKMSNLSRAEKNVFIFLGVGLGAILLFPAVFIIWYALSF